MGHTLEQSAYRRLTERLNRFPQGAPPSKLLTKILMVLFEEKEAERVSLLPIKPFTASKAARIWKVSENESRRFLDRLAHKALLVDMEVDEEIQYVLPPPWRDFLSFP